jgi:hypothetical protein
MPMFDESPFHRAKSRFALRRKNLRNRLSCQALDLDVAVEQMMPDALCDSATHRRLSSAHETDKIEIGFR